jgi:hypothetical protein
VVGAPLEDLLEPAVEVPHHRDALDDLLARELEDEAQHAVRRGMLRSHVEDELFGLEALVLDDGELDLRAFPDLTDLRLGAQVSLRV